MNEQNLRDYIMENMEPPHSSCVKINKDPDCNKFIKSMFNTNFWGLYNNYIKKQVVENEYIMEINKSITFQSIKKIADDSIDRGGIYIPKYLTKFIKQWNSNQDNFGKYQKLLREFERDNIIQPIGEYYWKCDTCDIKGIFEYDNENINNCPSCNNQPLIISQSQFPPLLKQCLSSNQFLEMFVAESLKKADWNRLYFETENGERIYTSLKLPGNPELIEVDCAGTCGSALILCEAKNIKKLTPNNIDKKLSQIDSFKNILNNVFNEEIIIDLVFVINGEIDSHASEYREKEGIKIHLFGANELENLPNLLRELQVNP